MSPYLYFLPIIQSNNLLLFLDTKAAANKYKWEIILDRSKKQTKKRGRAKLSIEDLNNELELKEERLSNMQSSLRRLKKYTKDEVITESDLEEFNELLSTDDEEENTGKCFMKTYMHLYHIHITAKTDFYI